MRTQHGLTLSNGGQSGHWLAPLAAIALIALLIYLFEAFLLVFGATLLAVLLQAPAAWLSDKTRMRESWALATVIIAVVSLVGGAGWLMGTAIATQFDQLSEQVPRMLTVTRERLSEYATLDDLFTATSDGAGVVRRGLRAVSATFGALANILIVLFMAVLLAAQPRLYLDGSVRLLPKARRARAREVLLEIGTVLRRWLLGQLALMSLVTVLTYVGLRLLDVELALSLALVAGVLTFVPFLGPLVAGAIAILVTLPKSPLLALYVGLLYVGVQAIEGMLEPLVQRKAVYLAPALLVLTQVILGVLAGPLGIILATPLAAAGLVCVRMLYIEDVLDDGPEADAQPS